MFPLGAACQMELEDQWWKGQLAAEIYSSLRDNELKLPSYKGRSPQLSLRQYFADLIAITSNHCGVCPPARHLAVYLLDLLMDRYDITVQQLHLVALSCLLLACKFEETEDRVPRLETLNSLSCMNSLNLVLTKRGVLQMELLLLKSLKWNLYLPTAAHFTDYCQSIAVKEEDLHDGWPMASLDHTKLYMAKYVDYFLEASLQDHGFLCFAPSLVAAACVAASRFILHLSPTWPSRLQLLTGYTWENLAACSEKLLMAHDSDVKEATKQQLPQLQAQAFYHSSGQAATAQYLQRPNLQYRQLSSQPGAPPTLRPAPYLSHSGSGLQAPGAGAQQGGQSRAVSLDPKATISNRSYQVSMHYSCTTPYF